MYCEKGKFNVEREVDYDLLNRQSIINHLYNVLCTCRPQRIVGYIYNKWNIGQGGDMSIGFGLSLAANSYKI